MKHLLLIAILAGCGGSSGAADAPLSPQCRLTVSGPFDGVYPCITNVTWSSMMMRGSFTASSHSGRSIDIVLGWPGEPAENTHYVGAGGDASGFITLDAGSDYNGYVWTAEAGMPGQGSYDLIFTMLGTPVMDGVDKRWFAHGTLTSTLEPMNGPTQGPNATLSIEF